jgi:hypothetical protein
MPVESKQASYTKNSLAALSAFERPLQRDLAKPPLFEAFHVCAGCLHAGSKYEPALLLEEAAETSN